MTPEEAKLIVDARYKHATEGKSLTREQKLAIVTQIVQEVRQYHNYLFLINGAPIKGVTLDHHSQEPVYYVG